MQTPEKTSSMIPASFRGKYLYDFELCADLQELKQTIATINRRGYDLISVTQDRQGMYTVFFKRRACG